MEHKGNKYRIRSRKMRTLMKASSILTAQPQEVARDAIGLAFLVLILFAGFLLPTVL